MALSPARCDQIVREYDAQGWHRTGSDVDLASADWLQAAMAAHATAVRRHAFPLTRMDFERCTVVVDGSELAAQPLLDSVFNDGEHVIAGNLDASPGSGNVAFVEVHHAPGGGPLAAARTAQWEAIIATIGDPANAITMINAWGYESPSGPPAVLVPASEAPRLALARQQHRPVEVRYSLVRREVTAHSVIGVIEGSEPGLSPVAVVTPRSGWWHCAGERGGGIAVLLELAREIRARPLRRNLTLLATTGHELNFMGIRRYLESNPAPFASWIHLGANIGAAGASTVVRTSEEPLAVIARHAVTGWPADAAPRPEVAQPGGTPVGEAAAISEHGGRYLSLVGRDFPLFHSLDDRWPAAIDPAAIAANAQLVLDMLRALDSALG